MAIVYKFGKLVNATVVGFYHCENGVADIYANDEDYNESFTEKNCKTF